jgi:hypothetical protein
VSAEHEPRSAEDEPGAPTVGGTDAGAGRARARRRFGRTRPMAAEDGAHDESLAGLHAEVVLLREENARLKALRHQAADIGRLLNRARSVRSTQADLESVTDDTAQMLVDGLVIRESLLEICQEIERTMVAFQAQLHALAPPVGEQAANPASEVRNGHGPSA